MKIAVDFDGTLITCQQKQMTLLHSLLAGEGYVVDVNRVWFEKRRGASTLQALVRSGISENLASRITDRWIAEIESPFWMQFDSLILGTAMVLQEWVSAGHELTIITSRCRPDLLWLQMHQLDLLRFFADIVVVKPYQVSESKAEHLVRIKANVFIGDSEIDGNAAGYAGIPFLAVASGQRTAYFLWRRGHRVFDDLPTVAQYLECL